MANQTLGCESCLTASCADYLTFEVDYLLDTGKFLLLLLFNQSIDSYDHFHISGITVGQYHIVIDRAELGLTALRTLQATKDSSNNSALTLISTSPTSLCLSV